MSNYTLVLVDTTGIQSYIFGSNRLRENVGASHLVHLATEGWLCSDNPKPLLGTDNHNLRNGSVIEAMHIENGLDAELLYAGGGNTVLLFQSDEFAQQFTRNLSRKLIEEAPGLDVVAVRQTVDLTNGSLAQSMKCGFEQMKKHKAGREQSQPLLGLSVTAACQSTGLVANFEQQEPGEDATGQILISSEVKAKWDINKKANERLETQFMADLPDGYEFPRDFDDLGRSKSDFSYIAVVHADGNGMGKLLQSIIKKYETQSGTDANRKLIREVRHFSKSANAAGSTALSAVIKEVADWNEMRRQADETNARKKKNSDRLQLSIRPIVFGGDDVTFVCDGRIGLKAAQIFLDAFSKQKIPNAAGTEQFGIAAAGVAIVKVHYPFARAYHLSEALCKNAKNTFDRQAPALDWHLAQSGLFGDLSEIRRREYNEQCNDKGEVTASLLMRPVTVGNTLIGKWHTWGNFVKLLTAFQDTEQWPRNKVMQLCEALLNGTDTVETFVADYHQLPKINATDSQHVNKGVSGGRSVYFDAIEMIEQEVWQ